MCNGRGSDRKKFSKRPLDGWKKPGELGKEKTDVGELASSVELRERGACTRTFFY